MKTKEELEKDGIIEIFNNPAGRRTREDLKKEFFRIIDPTMGAGRIFEIMMSEISERDKALEEYRKENALNVVSRKELKYQLSAMEKENAELRSQTKFHDLRNL